MFDGVPNRSDEVAPRPRCTRFRVDEVTVALPAAWHADPSQDGSNARHRQLDVAPRFGTQVVVVTDSSQDAQARREPELFSATYVDGAVLRVTGRRLPKHAGHVGSLP
jgi:hypothetical protein